LLNKKPKTQQEKSDEEESKVDHFESALQVVGDTVPCQ
jgi:hypothetical protein